MARGYLYRVIKIISRCQSRVLLCESVRRIRGNIYMLILYGITNEAVSICKDLRHNWLGHEVLNFDANYISKIYAEASPSRERFVERIKPGGAFDMNLKKAKALSVSVIDGFSPAQLVDNGPLGALQDDTRALIKRVLHNDYLEKTGIIELSESIQIAASDLSDAYTHFVKEWYSQPPAGQARIKESFEKVQSCGKALCEALGKLPKGVVLP